jgi:hypothetical protein
MIVKVLHLSSASRLSAYASRGGTLEAIAGSYPVGIPPGEIAQDLERVIALNGRVRQGQVLHIVLSPSPGDRPLTIADGAMLAQDTMDGLGLSDCPYAVWLHDEPGKVQHLHIGTTRVDGSGKRIDMLGERWRAKRVARKLEKAYGLQRVSGLHNGPTLPAIALDTLPLAGTLEPAGRLDIGVEDRIRAAIADLVRPGVTLGDLAQGLAAQGIELVPNWQNDRTKIGGMGFRCEGSYHKASKVDASLAALKTRGVSYEPDRDIPILHQLERPAPPPPPVTIPVLPVLPEITHDQPKITTPLPRLTPRQRAEQAVRGVGLAGVLAGIQGPRRHPGRVPSPGRFSLGR